MKKALLGLLIWLVIPAGVAAVAFFFIGPNLGQIPEAKKGAQAVSDLVAASTGLTPSTPEEQAKSTEDKPEPKSKLEVDPEPVRRSRNKHREAEITIVKEGVPKDESTPFDDPSEGEPQPDQPSDNGDPENDPASNPNQDSTTDL